MPPLTIVVVLLTIATMFVRNLAILAVFAPHGAATALWPLVIMAVMALTIVWLRRYKSRGATAEFGLTSPVSLRRVLMFGAVFLAIEVAGSLAQRYLGRFGFLMGQLRGRIGQQRQHDCGGGLDGRPWSVRARQGWRGCSPDLYRQCPDQPSSCLSANAAEGVKSNFERNLLRPRVRWSPRSPYSGSDLSADMRKSTDLFQGPPADFSFCGCRLNIFSASALALLASPSVWTMGRADNDANGNPRLDRIAPLRKILSVARQLCNFGQACGSLGFEMEALSGRRSPTSLTRNERFK